jgi:ABC-type Fe3+ transport system permease subunit
MANLMLPLFVPESWAPDRLLRPLIGVALFASAYMAEVVRGGLQAIPKGQFEGAMALGLNYPQRMRLIILPQALAGFWLAGGLALDRTRRERMIVALGVLAPVVVACFLEAPLRDVLFRAWPLLPAVGVLGWRWSRNRPYPDPGVRWIAGVGLLCAAVGSVLATGWAVLPALLALVMSTGVLHRMGMARQPVGTPR